MPRQKDRTSPKSRQSAPLRAENRTKQLARFCKRFRLSPRETEIVGLILQGEPPKRMASQLGVSINTIGTHCDRLHKKIDVEDAVGIVRMFMDFVTKPPDEPSA